MNDRLYSVTIRSGSEAAARRPRSHHRSPNIYTLVPSRADPEDILQETNLVVCKRFDDFREGTDYGFFTRSIPAARLSHLVFP